MSERISYTPAPQEMLEAHSNMSQEQKELSAVRQIFLESEHRVAELPQDLKYEIEHTNPTTGQLRSRFAGTFGGQELAVIKHSWDKGETWTYSGTRDGEKISEDEAKTLHEDIYPIVAVFDEMRKSENRAASDVTKATKEEQALHQKEVEDAATSSREVALVEGEKLGEVRALLGSKLEEIKASEQDNKFLSEVIDKIARLAANPDNDQPPDGPFRSGNTIKVLQKIDVGWGDDVEQARKKHKVQEEYARLKKLLYELLGVDERSPQEWAGGFAVEYLHSRVYDTVFPDMIIRESYDRRELGIFDNENGAQITIERNSRYQKHEPVQTAS